jgi:predicted DNA-binding transcriptional regulator YafY
VVKIGPSPTARPLRVLELLQAQPGITAARLAAQLDGTERAARRYVAILREAEYPRGVQPRDPTAATGSAAASGCPPLLFTATGAPGLVMAVLDGSHAAADAGDPVGSAPGKFIRALPENRPAGRHDAPACPRPRPTAGPRARAPGPRAHSLPPSQPGAG